VVHVEKDQLATLFDPSSPKALRLRLDHPIIVFCNRERGSLKAVRLLRAVGFTDVRHVRGGAAELARAQQDRYAHIG
jgi:FMN reductase